MAEKKQKGKRKKTAPEPTVLHESSADSAQNIGLEKLSDPKENYKASSHKRKHGGSDGADQERGSNH